jgi:hypothetical protein
MNDRFFAIEYSAGGYESSIKRDRDPAARVADAKQFLTRDAAQTVIDTYKLDAKVVEFGPMGAESRDE